MAKKRNENESENLVWEKTTNRFVLFFDILGFKDLVFTESHTEVLKKLELLSKIVESVNQEVKLLKIPENQSKAATFSDSIIVFSHSSTHADATKILMDAHRIQLAALESGIPIKGAISFGSITVDFEKSLFFGKPIIDAYLLHDELNVMTVIIDHNAEKKIKNFKEKVGVYKNCNTLLVSMKFGRVNHMILRLSKATMDRAINGLKTMYYSTSGKPRIYIDNTLGLYETISIQENNTDNNT